MIYLSAITINTKTGIKTKQPGKNDGRTVDKI